MKFCFTSFTTLKKLARALSEADTSLSLELQQKLRDEAIAPEASLTASSTSMALTQLGLIDSRETTSNLSV